MSQPVEPTPAAPANPPAPQPPAAPAPSPTPTPPPAAPAAAPAAPAFDPSTLTPEAQAYVQQQVSNADHKARTNARTAAAAQAQQELAAKLAPILGLGGQQLTPDQLIEQAQDAAYRATVQLAAHRHAGDHATSLLDSVAFLQALDDIEADLGTPEFDTALEAKIREQMAARNLTPGQPSGQSAPAPPGQPAGPRPDPSQGTRGTPPATRPTSITQALNAHYAAKAAGR